MRCLLFKKKKDSEVAEHLRMFACYMKFQWKIVITVLKTGKWSRIFASSLWITVLEFVTKVVITVLL